MNSANDKQRKALGKGLSALLPGRNQQPAAAVASVAAPAIAVSATKPGTLPLNLIQPNPMQPRTVFNSEGLQELAESIRANGIIQPLIVRQLGDGYQIVAGERRWRAARLAELQEVPVVVQDVADRSMLACWASQAAKSSIPATRGADSRSNRSPGRRPWRRANPAI